MSYIHTIHRYILDITNRKYLINIIYITYVIYLMYI